MADKLSKSSFQFIISTLLGIVVLVLGFQQSQIATVKGELTAYKSDMYKEITVIKTDIATISTNMNWLVSELKNSDIVIE